MCGSGGNNDPTGLRLTGAKQIIGQLNASRDQVGVINWDENIDPPTYPSGWESPTNTGPGLGNNFNAANTTIDSNVCGGTTDGEEAIQRSLRMLQYNPRPSGEVSNEVVIFLTDGQFNSGCTVNSCFADEIATANANNFTIYTIGLGSSVNTALL